MADLIALTGGRVVPIRGEVLDQGVVLVAGGRIEAVGARIEVPAGYTAVDVTGRWVLPGIVDAHSHIGTLEDGTGPAGDDCDEETRPVTAHIRALDAINPGDPAFADAVSGGVLAVGVNPGSCNPIGGECAALRTYGTRVEDMVLKAPSGIKSALGENPKKCYGDKGQLPSTRMGVAAVIRETLAKARAYAQHHDRVDPDLEALLPVLRGEIPWRQHCHRADDIATAMRLAQEFGYRLVIDHGTEAAFHAGELARRQIPVVNGPIIVGRVKNELARRSFRTPGLLAQAGVMVALATDHPVIPEQYLVYQAALAVRDGLPHAAALAALTINPAVILGVQDRIGSIEPGKDADLVVWSGDPLDPAQRVLAAYGQGRLLYEHRPGEEPW